MGTVQLLAIVVGMASGRASAGEGPRCKGRASEKDQELAFEVLFDATDGGPKRSVQLGLGVGPEFGRASVQSRLRTRLDAFEACYEPWVTVSGGPSLLLRVGFDVVDGHPEHVAVNGAPPEIAIEPCLREAVEATAMPCKLDGTGFAFPIHLSATP